MQTLVGPSRLLASEADAKEAKHVAISYQGTIQIELEQSPNLEPHKIQVKFCDQI
jgi:hypothetical protein